MDTKAKEVIHLIASIVTILGVGVIAYSMFRAVRFVFWKKLKIVECKLLIRERERWEDLTFKIRSRPNPWNIKIIDVGYITKDSEKKEISFGIIEGNTEIQYPRPLYIKFKFYEETTIKKISELIPQISYLYIKDDTDKVHKYRKRIMKNALKKAKRIN